MQPQAVVQQVHGCIGGYIGVYNRDHVGVYGGM